MSIHLRFRVMWTLHMRSQERSLNVQNAAALLILLTLCACDTEGGQTYGFIAAG